MSIAEKEGPIEQAGYFTHSIYQDILSLNTLRLRHPEADLSAVKTELEQLRDFLDSSLQEWK